MPVAECAGLWRHAPAVKTKPGLTSDLTGSNPRDYPADIIINSPIRALSLSLSLRETKTRARTGKRRPTPGKTHKSLLANQCDDKRARGEREARPVKGSLLKRQRAKPRANGGRVTFPAISLFTMRFVGIRLFQASAGALSRTGDIHTATNDRALSERAPDEAFVTGAERVGGGPV